MEIDFAYDRVFKLRVYKNDDDTWDFTRDLTKKRRLSFDEDLEPRPTKAARQEFGAVIMVYDLKMEKMSPQVLFNVFCLYGDVLRIKFLNSKPGCAMIEMANGEAANLVLENLNKCDLFGNEITIRYSKQEYLKSPGSSGSEVLKLANGSKSFQDFSADPNNRFPLVLYVL